MTEYLRRAGIARTLKAAVIAGRPAGAGAFADLPAVTAACLVPQGTAAAAAKPVEQQQAAAGLRL